MHKTSRQESNKVLSLLDHSDTKEGLKDLNEMAVELTSDTVELCTYRGPLPVQSPWNVHRSWLSVTVKKTQINAPEQLCFLARYNKAKNSLKRMVFQIRITSKCQPAEIPWL